MPHHFLGNARPQLALLVGHEVDVDPLEALLMCVRITAAEVAYFSARIADLDPKAVVVRPREEELDRHGDIHDLKKAKRLNMWIRERQLATERLAKYSKMAIDVGIEERLVRVAEQVGDQLAHAMEKVMVGLNLTDEQRKIAPALIRTHLAVLEGGAA